MAEYRGLCQRVGAAAATIFILLGREPAEPEAFYVPPSSGVCRGNHGISGRSYCHRGV